MAGKHGTEAIESLLTVVKTGALAILQNIQSDGFQPSDLWAPVQSEAFVTDLRTAGDQVSQVLPEIFELDGSDLWSLGLFVIQSFKDLQPEAVPAFQTARKTFAKSQKKSEEAK